MNHLLHGCLVIAKEVEQVVPCSIFKDRNLAPLESISEFLKEEKSLSYHEIAVFTGRNDRTIWTCYSRARKKRIDHPKQTPKTECVFIPLSIFLNRDLAPLEALTAYLKEKVNMSLHEIAVMLNRDDRTIWTSYDRSKKKRSEVKA